MQVICKLFFLPFCILLFLCNVELKAQQPIHFTIGEEELAGVEIYDIIQDHEDMYWIASDNGLIKYNGYEFTNIPSSGLLGSSVFEFKKFKKKIFCKNLSGQIILIEKNRARVVFQIPDSLMSTEFTYFIDKNGCIQILNNELIQLDSNYKIISVTSGYKETGSFYPGLESPDGGFVIQKSGSPNLYIYNEGEMRKEFVGFDFNTNYYTPFFLNKKLSFWNRENNQIVQRTFGTYYKLPNIEFVKKVEIGSRIFFDENSVWFMSPKSGALVLNHDLKPFLDFENIFPSVFISTVFKDKEGSYLLGTFGSGIVVIPKLKSLQLKLPNSELRINKLSSNGKDKLFIGTQNGEIYGLNEANKFSLEEKSKEGNIRFLKYLSRQNKLLINNALFSLNAMKGDEKIIMLSGAVKDLERIDSKKLILALNVGVRVIEVLPNKIIDYSEDYCSNFIDRTYCANFNPLSNQIYAGTAKGLKIGKGESFKYFTLEGKPLICNDIKWINNQMFVATQNDGILVFKNDKLLKIISTSTSLLANSVKQIKQYKNQLYVSMKNAFQVLNLEGEVLYTMSRADGVSIHQIIDFEILNDVLWIATKNDLRPINIYTLKTDKFVPEIKIESILINDKVKKVFTNTTLSYKTNQITFDIRSKSIKNRDDIIYKYMLEGYENNWKVNSFSEHIISYKLLPAGTYTFKVKAFCRGKESPVKTFSFSIAKPFWKTWWFLGGIIVLSTVLTWLIYKRTLNKNLKETRLKNELMATKLTAIKSQMNPHFIFNSLNSIQDLVLQQDANNAYDYISKFAMLVRKILHHSDLDFVDFDEELKIIQLYVELEKLRFKKDFNFTIVANDIGDIEIPPMLIQPYVENAIKHGLMHKKGAKELEIIFSFKDDTVICKIKDNGIGRVESKAINLRQRKNHQSFTLNSMEHRFDLLKTSFKGNLGAVFTDLYDENGKAKGTSVSLTIPCKRKF